MRSVQLYSILNKKPEGQLSSFSKTEGFGFAGGTTGRKGVEGSDKDSPEKMNKNYKAKSEKIAYSAEQEIKYGRGEWLDRL